MSAIDKLTELRKVMSRMTGEEAEVIRAWEKTIKTKEAYKSLAKHIAFQDFIEQVKAQYKAAIETIINKDTPEKERQEAFLIRDCWGWVLNIFNEAKLIDDQMEKMLSEKITEFEGYNRG